MPGLDGLRAIAVLAVLIYHAEPAWLPGGFLGVEIFFVISGYIITAGLLAEWQTAGSISLLRFWAARARRLLPAVYFLILAVLAGALLLLRDEVVDLREAGLASTFYVTNWYLVLDQQSYFESWLRPSLLRHLWSLAVEEQFYLIWPPLLAFVLLKLPRSVAFVTVLVLAGASTAWMAYLHATGADVSRLYYGTDTRAAGFLIGAALAFAWRQPALHNVRRWGRIGVESLGLAGAALLVAALVLLDENRSFLYQGGFAAVSLCTAAFIAAVVLPAGKLAGLSGARPLVWLGVRSYSVYLWHWPVFMLTRPGLDVSLDGPMLLLLRFGLTLALAHLSYHLIEQPFRRGALRRGWQSLRNRGRVVAWGVALPLVAGSAAAALTVVILAGVAHRPALPSTVASISIITYGADQRGELPGAPTVFHAPVTADPDAWGYFPPPEPTPEVIAEAPVPEPTAVTIDAGSSTTVQTPPPSAPPYLPDAILPPEIRVTVLGDSVLLGAAYDLVRLIPNLDFDAAVGRQAAAYAQMIESRKGQGTLGSIVVVQVGNNGPVTPAQFETIMNSLWEVPRVIVVNVTVPRQWQDSNNGIFDWYVPQYPNAILVDWHGASAGRPDFFADDGVHLTPSGASMLVALIAEAIAR